MIIDAFGYFNEEEVLDLRLNYLKDKVDKFVLLEANITYSGHPKKFYFDENKEKFKEFNIEHCMITDLTPPGNHPLGERWIPENNQRRLLKPALLSMNLKDDDWVIMGDLDEIPDKRLLDNNPGIFIMDSYMYYLNCFTDHGLAGCTYMRWRDMKDRDFQDIRNKRHGMPHKNGGWHFSYMGGLDKVRYKLQSFAHHELDTPEVHGSLERKFNNIESMFAPVMQPILPLEIDDTWPDYLVQNQEKYKELIK